MPDATRLPRPAAVLFDLDGTLIDTVDRRIEAWRQTFSERSIEVDAAWLGTLIGVDGKRLAREVCARAGRTIDHDEAEAIDSRCGELYEQLNIAPRPLPGVQELVETLDRAGVPWAIATSSRREQVTTSVEALPIDHEPTIVDGSHVKHAKPEPDLLLLGAERLDVDPTRCWYVGDSTWDIASAIAAGMLPIGVTAGSAVSREILAGAGAALVVETLAELVDRIQGEG
jgi:HAD superfamily hydrolase (TIGR01509 family)